MQVFAGLKKAGSNRLGQQTPDGWKEEKSDRKTWLRVQAAYKSLKAFEGLFLKSDLVLSKRVACHVTAVLKHLQVQCSQSHTKFKS